MAIHRFLRILPTQFHTVIVFLCRLHSSRGKDYALLRRLDSQISFLQQTQTIRSQDFKSKAKVFHRGLDCFWCNLQRAKSIWQVLLLYSLLQFCSMISDKSCAGFVDVAFLSPHAVNWWNPTCLIHDIAQIWFKIQQDTPMHENITGTISCKINLLKPLNMLQC